MAVDRCVVGGREDYFHFTGESMEDGGVVNVGSTMADYPPLLASSVFDSLKCNVPQI